MFVQNQSSKYIYAKAPGTSYTNTCTHLAFISTEVGGVLCKAPGALNSPKQFCMNCMKCQGMYIKRNHHPKGSRRPQFTKTCFC